MISVIIPVYKVEKYLEQCIRSVVEQTMEQLEIILVDDGSPDQCPELCDAWSTKDDRIKVLHQTNGGLSDARNAGLAVATGDYIGFVDSDDFLDHQMYEKLYQSMQRQDADIAAGCVRLVWDTGRSEEMISVAKEQTLSNVQATEALFEETLVKKPVWYKLYKREVIQDICFAVGKCHEDDFWSYQVMANAKKVVLVPDAVYYYRQRGDSIMGQGLLRKRLDAMEAMEERYGFFCEHYPHLAQKARWKIYEFGVYLMQKIIAEEKSAETLHIQKEIRAYLHRYEPTWQEIRQMPRGMAMWTAMEKLSLGNTCRLRNALHRGVD